jgi:hypothetical protein
MPQTDPHFRSTGTFRIVAHPNKSTWAFIWRKHYLRQRPKDTCFLTLKTFSSTQQTQNVYFTRVIQVLYLLGVSYLQKYQCRLRVKVAFVASWYPWNFLWCCSYLLPPVHETFAITCPSSLGLYKMPSRPPLGLGQLLSHLVGQRWHGHHMYCLLANIVAYLPGGVHTTVYT